MSTHRSLVRFALALAIVGILPGVVLAICPTSWHAKVNGLGPIGGYFNMLGSPSGQAATYLIQVYDANEEIADVDEVWFKSAGFQWDTPPSVNLFGGGPQALKCNDIGVDGDYVYLEGGNDMTWSPTFGGHGFSGEAGLIAKCEDGNYRGLGTFNAVSTDIEGDGDTDEDDVDLLVAAIGTQQLQFDLNFKDGVDAADAAIIRAEASLERVHPEYIKYYTASSWWATGCYDTQIPMPTSGYRMTAPGTINTLNSQCNNVYWTAPGEDGSTGTVTSYEIRWSSSPINAGNPGTIVTSGVPAPLAPGIGQVFNSTSYAAGTYFAVRAVDDVGNMGAISNVVQKDCTAPGAVTNLSALADLNRIQVSWTVPGDDGNTGQANTCLVKYSTGPITSANWGSATEACAVVPGAPGTSACCVIYSLNSCTNYYFAVKTADDNTNWSGLSNVVLKKTKCGGSATLPCDDGKAALGDGDAQPEITQLQATGPAVVHSGNAEFQLRIPAQLEGADMRASIFDVRGHLVSSLYSGTAPSSTGTVHWNLRDTRGKQMPSGVYYLSAQVGDQDVQQRVIVVR